MSNQIIPFEFGGEQIRVEMIDGEPWFIAADIARVLGYRDAHAIARNVEDEEKGAHPVSTPGGVQQLTVINESGLYNAIFASKVPGAREFKKHVTSVILPQIRRTGSYAKPLTLAEKSLALLSELTEEVQRQQAELVEIRPLASQARNFNNRKGNTGRQAFAREIVSWALGEGYKVTANQVYAFIGVKLDMFVHGAGLRSHGHATLSGERRGLSRTDKGESRHNGHNFEQGMLTPKGVEYAWARIETYVREHGHLEVPSKEIAA